MCLDNLVEANEIEMQIQFGECESEFHLGTLI
jgi:hypothetical protein